MDNTENTKAKLGIIAQFVDSVENAKRSFIIYNTVINRISATYGDKLDANAQFIQVLSDAERMQLGRCLEEMQYYLLDCQIYFKAIVKKKGLADKEEVKKIIVDSEDVLKLFVPEPVKVKELLQQFIEFVADNISADMTNNAEVVKGVIR